jgi:hypothetical protein
MSALYVITREDASRDDVITVEGGGYRSDSKIRDEG